MNLLHSALAQPQLLVSIDFRCYLFSFLSLEKVFCSVLIVPQRPSEFVCCCHQYSQGTLWGFTESGPNSRGSWGNLLCSWWLEPSSWWTIPGTISCFSAVLENQAPLLTATNDDISFSPFLPSWFHNHFPRKTCTPMFISGSDSGGTLMKIMIPEVAIENKT